MSKQQQACRCGHVRGVHRIATFARGYVGRGAPAASPRMVCAATGPTPDGQRFWSCTCQDYQTDRDRDPVPHVRRNTTRVGSWR